MNDIFKYTREADISPCGLYRYTLHHRWDHDSSEPQEVLGWIMLNPSTADARQDDPTIRRVQRFSEDWGYGGFKVCNLFAWRATDPEELKEATHSVGPLNDGAIIDLAAACPLIICAWGTGGALNDRAAHVLRLLGDVGANMAYLKLSKDGHPCHPLYLKGDLKPKKFNFPVIPRPLHP